MTERKGEAEGWSRRKSAFLRTVVRVAVQEVLKAEMAQAVGAAKGEPTASGSATAPVIPTGR